MVGNPVPSEESETSPACLATAPHMALAQGAGAGVGGGAGDGGSDEVGAETFTRRVAAADWGLNAMSQRRFAVSPSAASAAVVSTC